MICNIIFLVVVGIFLVKIINNWLEKRVGKLNIVLFEGKNEIRFYVLVL